jgi:hypothetical protein
MHGSRSEEFDDAPAPSPVVAHAHALRGIEEIRRGAAARNDVSASCAELLAVVVEAMEAARASLMVVNPRTGRLRILAAFGLPQDIVGLDLEHRSRRISDWVRRERRAVLLNGEVRDQRFDGSAPREVGSALCLPLLVRQGVIGVLNLARIDAHAPFAAADLAIGEHLAHSLATAVEEGLERDAARRSWARLAEGAVLPASFGPGLFEGRSSQLALTHLPSGLRGGDFAERAVLPDGSQVILLADVPGHGADALALGALVRGVFLPLAQAQRSPADVARRMNVVLRRRLEGQGFAAAWIATLAPNGQLLSCVAGFPPPCLLPGDGAPRALCVGGALLGATEGTDFQEEAIRLLPGDVVIAVSDGVLCAHDAAGSEFGAHRVEEIALEQRRQPLDQLSEAIARGALEHGASGIPADDLTVLALRYSRDV